MGRGTSELQDAAERIFSGLAKSYDWTLDVATIYQDRYWKKWLISKAKLRGYETILDAGCGSCVLEERLGDSRCSVIGLDLTPEMLKISKEKRLECVPDLLNGDAQFLPFSDESFDVVFSCYVAKYCIVARYCSELARVLKPGGRLLVYDFARPSGAAAPILAFYTYGLLPAAGRMLSSTQSGVAYTFRELPGIIRKSSWNFRFPHALAQNHLVLIENESLSGGAVHAFVASKES